MCGRVTLLAFVVVLSALNGTVAARAQGLPPGKGREIVETRCTQCHGTDVIRAQGRSPEEWNETVSRMVAGGTTLSDVEFETVLTYLSAALGPGSPAIAKPTAAPLSNAPASTPVRSR
jgi:mono/diheme cytochrome c family protein